jgi:hypothetical protein
MSLCDHVSDSQRLPMLEAVPLHQAIHAAAAQRIT